MQEEGRREGKEKAGEIGWEISTPLYLPCTTKTHKRREREGGGGGGGGGNAVDTEQNAGRLGSRMRPRSN